MSSKSISIKSDNKSNSSIHLSDRMSNVIEEVTKSIVKDLHLLRPIINFSHLTQSVSQIKRSPKNCAINESEIMSKISEINAKKEEFLNKNESKVDNKSINFEDLNEKIEEIDKIFPSFNSTAKTLTQMNQNKDNCLNCKQIEVNEETINQLLKTTQNIEHFQRSNKYLKTSKDI